MILRGPHAEFEIKAAGISRREYEPGCLELRLGAAVDLGGSPAIVVYGDPGEPESALQAALSEELCRIWCRDIWGWTDQAGALDQDGGLYTGQQVNEICAALRALKRVKATGRGDPTLGHYFTESPHEFRDPLVPALKQSPDEGRARMRTEPIHGIFDRPQSEEWGPQYQPLDGDDTAYVKYIGKPRVSSFSGDPIRSSRPWLLADLPHEYDAEALLHIEKWLKTRDPIGVLT